MQATIENNNIQLKIPYGHPDFNSMLNQIRALPERRYQPTSKIWTVPLTNTNLEAVAFIGFDLPVSASDSIINEKEKAEQVMKDIEAVNFTSDILYDYQTIHAKQIIYSILKNNAALDASDTGTGKTFVALAVAKHFGLFPIVITPKSVIPSWQRAAELFEIDCFVCNYEQYKNGNTEWLKKKSISSLKKKTEGEEKEIFEWNTSNSHILIFDEAHKTKNSKTQNTKMLETATKTESKILCLSATIADNPLHLFATGKAIGIFKTSSDYWRWAYSRGVRKGFWGMEFTGTKKNLKKIHGDVFPERGSRISIKTLGDKFPSNKIITDPYSMANDTKIESVYENMRSEIGRLSAIKKEDKGASILTEILRARQEIELLKVPTMVELAQNHVEEGASIVIFVNFKETIKALSERLKTDCIIDGGTTGEQRQINIDNFQADKERIILCNIRAGGVGISLHDLNGMYNRVSLISPTFSAQDLLQVFGRIHRAGGKSSAIQKLIFCAGTIEEGIAEAVNKKIDNISMINDGDLADENILNLLKKEAA